MGIKSRDGALFMATGIDNSGLYEGKREAMGIIKTLASEVTSFDIYSVVSVSVRQLLLHKLQKAHTTLKKSSGRTCWKWRPFPHR